MAHKFHVAHHTPGRVRLRASDARGSRAVVQRMSRQLATIQGVQRVDSNPVTGSVVVHYTKGDAQTEQRLEMAVRDENELLSLAVPDLDKVEQIAGIIGSDVTLLSRHSRAAAALVHAAGRLNLLLMRTTNNMVDLKLLVPVLCAAGSLLFVDRKKAPILWTMLLFASFHTFLMLYQPGNRPANQPATPGRLPRPPAAKNQGQA